MILKKPLCTDTQVGLTEALKDEIEFLGKHLKSEEMVHEFNEIISQSVESENYKTAAILEKWRDTFLEPK